jgi:hypothetical protein
VGLKLGDIVVERARRKKCWRRRGSLHTVLLCTSLLMTFVSLKWEGIPEGMM